jgi:putative addiction module component (TIGR02574 family)
MKTVDQVRKEAMTLSAGERASLAHDLILSLEDPDAYELSPAWEAAICRRVRKVKRGNAAGRPAAKVFADIEDGGINSPTAVVVALPEPHSLS